MALELLPLKKSMVNTKQSIFGIFFKFSFTLDDPYSNPDQSAANDLEPPNYDYSGISPTAGFDDLSPMPDYGSYQNDPCAVSRVKCGIVKDKK